MEGELRWIDDLDLLNLLSATYHYITRIIYLELEYFNPSFIAQARTTKCKEIVQGQRNFGVQSAVCPDALELIGKTIVRIDSSEKVNRTRR